MNKKIDRKYISLSLCVAMIFIVAPQLFAARTVTGITGAVTQPSAQVTKGMAVTATVNSAGLRQHVPFFFTNKFNDILLAHEDYTVSDVLDSSGSYGLSLSRGGTRFEYGLTYAGAEHLNVTGFHMKYRFLEVEDLMLALGTDHMFFNKRLWSNDLYVVASYPVDEKLMLSFNIANTGIIADLRHYNSDDKWLKLKYHTNTTNNTTYGLAANYEYNDKLDLAADYMFDVRNGDFWGIEAEYGINDGLSASAGLIASSDVGIFTAINWKF